MTYDHCHSLRLRGSITGKVSNKQISNICFWDGCFNNKKFKKIESPPYHESLSCKWRRAVEILTSRLPELPINRRTILSRLINGAEVNLVTVNGFQVTLLAQLDRARLAKEQAEEYGFEVNFTSNTQLNVDKPIPKRAAANEKPSA
jgi:hypothetical protein